MKYQYYFSKNWVLYTGIQSYWTYIERSKAEYCKSNPIATTPSQCARFCFTRQVAKKQWLPERRPALGGRQNKRTARSQSAVLRMRGMLSGHKAHHWTAVRKGRQKWRWNNRPYAIYPKSSVFETAEFQYVCKVSAWQSAYNKRCLRRKLVVVFSRAILSGWK